MVTLKGVPLRRDSAASKERREGGVEGEREDSTPKSVSVASYREVVPCSRPRLEKHFKVETAIKLSVGVSQIKKNNKQPPASKYKTRLTTFKTFISIVES